MKDASNFIRFAVLLILFSCQNKPDNTDDLSLDYYVTHKAIDALAQYQAQAHIEIRLLDNNDPLLANKHVRNIRDLVNLNSSFLEEYYYNEPEELTWQAVESYLGAVESKFADNTNREAIRKLNLEQLPTEKAIDSCMQKQVILRGLLLSDEAITSNAKNISLHFN